MTGIQRLNDPSDLLSLAKDVKPKEGNETIPHRIVHMVSMLSIVLFLQDGQENLERNVKSVCRPYDIRA
jgi:hypothetical protein